MKKKKNRKKGHVRKKYLRGPGFSPISISILSDFLLLVKHYKIKKKRAIGFLCFPSKILSFYIFSSLFLATVYFYFCQKFPGKLSQATEFSVEIREIEENCA